MRKAFPVVAALLIAHAPAAAQYNLYYGNFHSHCNLSDDATGPNSGPPSEAFTYARDVAGIDILALTDHTHYMTFSEYTTLQNEADNFTQNGVFVAIAAQEHGSLSSSRAGAFGHVNVYESSALIPQYINGDDFRYNLPGTYQYIANNVDDTTGQPLVGSLNHPYNGSGEGMWAQFQDFAYDPVGDQAMQMIEVLNGKRSSSYEPEYHEVLAKGWHVGALGNQDNHEGSWGDQENNLGNVPLTGVWAPALTKTDVLEALAARRTFAMEVEPVTDRISLEFTADGNWMGSEYSTAADSVQFTVTVSSQNDIASINLYRNGTVIRTTGVLAPSFTWNTIDTPGPGDFYYHVRVSQADGDRAWTSPIWIESTSTFSLPIADAKELDANGIPTRWFQTVSVQGIVTVPTGTVSPTDNLVFIQDVTGGIMIWETGAQTAPVALGDNVRVTGLIDFLDGQTFIAPTNIEILGSAAVPDPVFLTTDEIATNGELYESLLVEVHDATITAGIWPNPGFDSSGLLIDDDSGDLELFIDGDAGLTEPAFDPFSVRGVVRQFDGTLPYFDDYAIMPRFQTDLFEFMGTGIDELPAHHATTRTVLHQNRPNPFGPSTAVRFDLAGAGPQPVRLEIFDVSGRLVRTLVDRSLPPGEFEVRWDGRTDRGEKVAAGVYFYRLTTPERNVTRKMALLK